MKKDSIIDFWGFIAVKVTGILMGYLPLSLSLWIGRRWGDIAYFVNSKRRSIAYANLKSAFPEKGCREIKNIVRRHFENLGMSVAELLKLPAVGKRYLDRYVAINYFDRISQALHRGKGVILLTAHFGNWELSSLAASAKGRRMSVFVREQKYPRLNALLNSYREMTGCRVVTKGFSVRDIIKTLNNNGVVGMLGDQDAGPNGFFVDFFGRPASMASGAITFSRKTGAVILPSFTRRVGYDRHEIEIREPLRLIETGDDPEDIRANLRNITAIIEDIIRRYPDQWLWSHKRWKSSPYRAVLVLVDRKAGHSNQSMAIAEAIEEALGARLEARGIEAPPMVKIDMVEIKFKNKFAQAFLDLASFFAGNRCQGCLRCLNLALSKETFDSVKNRYADIIISCGASTVATNIFLKYENNAKNIVIMKPGPGRNRKFDLVILPGHDVLKKSGRNIVVTDVAPNRITERLMEDSVSRLEAETQALKGYRCKEGIGLLIGGNTKNFKLQRRTVEEVLDGVSALSEQMHTDIFISTSRRTPGEIALLLKNKMSKNSRCKILVIANEKNIEGVVPAIFALSKIIVVSPDSISMMSEAVSSGKYVVVFRQNRQRIGGKYGRAIENLEKGGYIKTAFSDRIADTIKYLLKERPAIKKSDDRHTIIERLKAIV